MCTTIACTWLAWGRRMHIRILITGPKVKGPELSQPILSSFFPSQFPFMFSPLEHFIGADFQCTDKLHKGRNWSLGALESESLPLGPSLALGSGLSSGGYGLF